MSLDERAVRLAGRLAELEKRDAVSPEGRSAYIAEARRLAPEAAAMIRGLVGMLRRAGAAAEAAIRFQSSSIDELIITPLRRERDAAVAECSRLRTALADDGREGAT